MIRVGKIAIAALVLASAAPAASLAIGAGTTLTGTIDQGFDSNSARVNQPFTISNAHSSDHDVNGATIYGHVRAVQKAGQGTAGKIELDVDKINARSGNIYKVVGAVTEVQVNTKSNAGKETAAVAGGALVGALVGKGTAAAIGGGAGYLLAKNNKQDVSIPAGSYVTVQILQSQKVN